MKPIQATLRYVHDSGIVLVDDLISHLHTVSPNLDKITVPAMDMDLTLRDIVPKIIAGYNVLDYYGYYIADSSTPCSTRQIRKIYLDGEAHENVVFEFDAYRPSQIKPHVATTPMELCIQKSIETFDSTTQDMILLEEMMELGTALLHHRRDKATRAQIVEELAHVWISLNVVKSIFKITDEELDKEALKKIRNYQWEDPTMNYIQTDSLPTNKNPGDITGEIYKNTPTDPTD